MGVSSSDEEVDVDKPLPVGKTVDEVFGLPPIIPLSVQWTCTQSSPPTSSTDAGQLEFFSEKGLEGVASNCAMIFDITQQQQQSTTTDPAAAPITTDVVLQMKYTPSSFFAVLAVPILTLDNTIALQFLLPAAMRQQQPELDTFRNWMGILYGLAGVAHLADCLVGDSQLLTAAGAPAFDALPLVGQLYSILWCCMGPVAFALKRRGKGFADMGLILYGLVEVVGAGLVHFYYCYSTTVASGSSTMTDPLLSAVVVQAIVAWAWFYSANNANSTVD